ncbi:MAG: guanylate kinase [Eubacteriales bacterium]|nr:guanylate kinase [Eubacteriales bacterium]
MNDKGLLLIISGFSGAGKGTIINGLINKYRDRYTLSISATTRGPREGEVEGISYFFKTKDEFTTMIENDELIEYANYVDNYYGTPKKYVDESLESGKNVILEIEIQGALQVKEMYPQAVSIFIMPPSAQILIKRLLERGTEDLQTIKKRMTRAQKEGMRAKYYDYLIINDDLQQSIDSVDRIIRCEHMKCKRNFDLIDSINKEVYELTRGD